MSFVTVAIGVGAAGLIGGIGGAIISSNAAGDAADKQAKAAGNASQLQYQATKDALAVQQSQFATQQANAQPWMTAGLGALGQMQDQSWQKPYTMADFQQDPSYQFDLSQGQKAIQQAAAAQGGIKSGGMLKSIAQYTQGMASNEYGKAFDRYQTQQSNAFNRLGAVAGLGAQASGQMAQVGMHSADAQAGIIQAGGNNQAEIASGLGNAQAASTIAQGNIWGGTLSSLGSQVPAAMMGAQSAGTMNSLLSRMYQGQTPGAGAAPGGGYASPAANAALSGQHSSSIYDYGNV